MLGKYTITRLIQNSYEKYRDYLSGYGGPITSDIFLSNEKQETIVLLGLGSQGKAYLLHSRDRSADRIA